MENILHGNIYRLTAKRVVPHLFIWEYSRQVRDTANLPTREDVRLQDIKCTIWRISFVDVLYVLN